MNKIDEAFATIHRAEFLPPEVRDYAGDDRPLPIGYDQTNSQPSTVRQMLVWLDPQPGQKVLDVGSGSGWTSALIGAIVGESGHVYAVERIPQLVEFGKQNITRIGMKNVSCFVAGKHFGLAEHAPYDRILVSASADDVPSELLDQLSDYGTLVIPVKNDILVITKREGTFHTEKHSGYMFVPLIHDN